MREDRQSAQPASVWNRFWSPRAYVEVVPADATPDEAQEIRFRNAMWLKSHMDIYILRWGLLWVFTVLVAILTSDEEFSDQLYALILAATVMSALGLASMLRIYHRASKSLRR